MKILIDIIEPSDYIKSSSRRKGETQDGAKAIDIEST
jgi:hypothetical protein